MRAGTQADLIYKRGQAGITKASVTIVFDNSDKAAPGYTTPQITVTRQVRLIHFYAKSNEFTFSRWIFSSPSQTRLNGF